MSTSDKQLEANRQNAKKSTGPRTPEGKARSSQNAIKHGAYAKQVVLPWEDVEAFQKLQEDFLKATGDFDVIQAALARQAASDEWRMMRLERMETGFFKLRFNIAWISQAQRPGNRDAFPYETEEEKILGAEGRAINQITQPFDRLGTLYRALNHVHNRFYKTIRMIETRQAIHTGVAQSRGTTANHRTDPFESEVIIQESFTTKTGASRKVPPARKGPAKEKNDNKIVKSTRKRAKNQPSNIKKS